MFIISDGCSSDGRRNSITVKIISQLSFDCPSRAPRVSDNHDYGRSREVKSEKTDNAEKKIPIRVATCEICSTQDRIQDQLSIMDPYICDDCYRGLMEGEIIL